MNRVLVQGAFDIIHVGHVKTLEFAKAKGDYLIVALNTNELIASYKRREAVMSWDDKRDILLALRCVDEVVPAPYFSPLLLLMDHHVDVYVVAQEWESSKAAEIAYMNRHGARVVISPRFTTFSTTEIKARLLAEHLKAKEAA